MTMGRYKDDLDHFLEIPKEKKLKTGLFIGLLPGWKHPNLPDLYLTVCKGE